MSSRCVCGHGRFLHRKGVCFASIDPCACTSYETELQADRPSAFKKENYDGFYLGKTYSA